ncbi:hypothetical protein PoB_003949100 [Plakobranchus ocellatus]|uniref:Uncharacterized protein n=1 Tax=Plakobranchus ocellatus TaxID=259542 RepID=A0AAV4AP84_9GAST|nr:hypothetical protein PoB_003949100 [Plakobranchus ocellatus]
MLRQTALTNEFFNYREGDGTEDREFGLKSSLRPPPGQARNHDRKVPTDLRSCSKAILPLTAPIDQTRTPLDQGGCTYFCAINIPFNMNDSEELYCPPCLRHA